MGLPQLSRVKYLHRDFTVRNGVLKELQKAKNARSGLQREVSLVVKPIFFVPAASRHGNGS